MAMTRAQREAAERLRGNNEYLEEKYSGKGAAKKPVYKTGNDEMSVRPKSYKTASQARHEAKKAREQSYVYNAARNARDIVNNVDPYAWQNRGNKPEDFKPIWSLTGIFDALDAIKKDKERKADSASLGARQASSLMKQQGGEIATIDRDIAALAPGLKKESATKESALKTMLAEDDPVVIRGKQAVDAMANGIVTDQIKADAEAYRKLQEQHTSSPVGNQRAALNADKKFYSDAYDAAGYQYAAQGAADYKENVARGAQVTSEVNRVLNGKYTPADTLRDEALGGRDTAAYITMTRDEIDTYRYWLAKNKEVADRYIKHLKPQLIERASDIVDQNIEDIEDEGFKKVVRGFMTAAGSGKNVGRAIRNIPAAIVGSEDVEGAGIVERGQQKMAQRLEGVEKGVNDFIYNMIPMIPTAAVSMVPGAGAALSAGYTAARSYGGTYADTIQQGYAPGEAQRYALVNAASEAGMQYLLGGIAKTGGSKSLSSTLQRAAQKAANNPAAAKGLAILGNMGSEAAEEYLQANLDPVLRNIILDENNELNPVSRDKWEAAVMGALMSLVMNAPSEISEGVRTAQSGRAYNSPDVMQALVERGLASGADAAAYGQAQRLAGKLEAGKNISNFEAGSLARANEAAIAAEARANAILDKTGAQRAYDPNETVKLKDGREVVIVARDGSEYTAIVPGENGYTRITIDEILHREGVRRAVDAFLHPEDKADITGKYDHRHVEKTADQTFLDKLTQGRGVKAVVEDMPSGTEAFYDRSTNTIHFAPDSTRADVIGGVTAHELAHAAEASEHYKAYSDYAVQRLFGNDTDALRQAVEAKQEQYIQHGVYLSDADAVSEIVADYTRNLYKSPADIEALVTGNRGMAQSIYDSIRTAIQKIRAFFKGDEAALRNIREYQDLRRAQKLFERALSAMPEVQAEAAPAYAIETIPGTNKQFVKADRQVIKGDTPKGWAQSVENYINEEIRNGKDVQFMAADGDVLTITADTAGKAKFRNNIKMADGTFRKMTDEEFQAKLHAEAHIDELAQVSHRGKNVVPDYKNHSFAKDGFNYRTAYFEDADGQYYRVTMSVGIDGNIKTIYNVGKMQKNTKFSLRAQRPERLDKSRVKNSVFIDSIPQTDGNVNRKYSLREDGAPGDADVPPAQMEYIPKPMGADTPPAQREYIPKPMDDAASAETEQDRKARILRGALKDGHEITPGEFKTASLIHRDAAAEFEVVDSRLNLTEQEKNAGKQIAQGNYDLSKFSGDPKILEWAKAYEGRSNAERVMHKYRMDLRKAAREHAMEVIASSDMWKDKKLGVLLATDTAYRNNIDVAGRYDAEGAKRLQREYFDPVAENEAKATRYINGLNKRIKALGLSKAEAVLVQAYGEGLISDTDLAGYARGPFKKIAFQNEESLYQKEFKKPQKIDESKVKNAAKTFREIYDELIELANDARVRNGYAPITPRANYFPHFNEMTTKEKALAAFGIDVTGADAIPEGIAGITEFFKPGTKWFANFQQREGNKTAFDAVEGFDGYIRGIKDVIFHTDDIQRLRALETALRSRHAPKTIKQKIDEINADPTRTAESKQSDIQELLKNVQDSNLSNYISWLHEYTNGLAGKKSTLDRAMEQMGNRKAYTVMRKLQGRVASNMIGYNVGSWLTNFIPLAQAHGQIKTVNMLKGVKDTIKSWAKNDGFVQNSDFLVNRRGTDTLSKDTLQKFSDAGVKPMEWIDQFVSETIVRAKYAEEVKAGATPEEAMRSANQTAANIMADRSYGQMPTLFNAKNPLVKTLTMFQLEVNNQYKNLFKDLPRSVKGSGGKAALAIALGLLKYCVGAYLYNELYEKLAGRRPAFDPIGMIKEAAKDFSDENMPKAQAATNLVSNVAEQIPFIGGLVGGGRVPISAAIPFGGSISDIAGNVGKVATGNESAKEELWKELLKPAWYIAPPGGGGAAKKAVEGAQTITRGGEYGVDSEGNKKLKFATDGDGIDILRALVFGKYATEGGQEYIGNGFKGLSVKQTEAHTNLVKNGIKPERAEKIMREISKITGEVDTSGETIMGSEKRNRIKMIEGYGLTPEQTYGLYYDLFFDDEMKEKMDVAVREFGISKASLNEIYEEDAYIVPEKGAAGKTLSDLKSVKLKEAIDNLNLSKNKDQREAQRKYLYESFNIPDGVVTEKVTKADVAQEIDRQEALAEAVPKETYTAFDEMEWDSENEEAEKGEWILENCKSEDEIAAMYTYYMESKDADERNTIAYAQDQGVRPSALVQRRIQQAEEKGQEGDPEQDAIWEDGKMVTDEHGTIVSGSKKAQACANLLDSGYTDQEKAYFYQKEYSTDDKFVASMLAGIPVDAYIERKAEALNLIGEKDENGKTISGTKKEAIRDYIYSLDLTDAQKALLFAQEYEVSGAEAQAVREYVDGLDVTDAEREMIYSKLKLGGSSGGSSRRGRSGRRSSGKSAAVSQEIPDTVWNELRANVKTPTIKSSNPVWETLEALLDRGDKIREETMQQELAAVDATPYMSSAWRAERKREIRKRYGRGTAS